MKTEEGMKRGKELAKLKHTSIRFMTEFYSPASNYVYGDRIAILFWYKEFPFAVRIIDKNLAESYKDHFKTLWDSFKVG
jgi:hypothetical protein